MALGCAGRGVNSLSKTKFSGNFKLPQEEVDSSLPLFCEDGRKRSKERVVKNHLNNSKNDYTEDIIVGTWLFGSILGRKSYIAEVLPWSSFCFEGLIDQSELAETGVRVSLALDQALSTGYSGCLKIGN